MCVEIEETEVNVEFIRLHLGHQCEVTRMVLSNDERACISGKLRQCVSVDQIMQDIRNISNPNPEKFDRIHYTEKEKIYTVEPRLSELIGTAPSLDTLKFGYWKYKINIFL
ncbi:hypothetical protein QTP88_021563 [Uroleucon formosanum]